jgi:hypothetical protein
MVVGFGMKGLGDSVAHTFRKTFLDKFLLVGGEGVLETTIINRSNKNTV